MIALFGEIWLWVALGFVLGVWPVGYWIWHRAGHTALAAPDNSADLQLARRAADDAAAARTRAETELAEANARLAPLNTEIATLKLEIERQNEALRMLRPGGEGDATAALQLQLDACRAEVAALKGQAMEPVAAPQAFTAPVAAPATASAPVPPVTDAPLPTFLAAPVGEPDNLMLIKGIGPKLNALLNSLGVFHFRQIAGWNADQVAEVDAKLEAFKGRIARDKWQEQAGLLATDQVAEFEARFGKLGSEIKK